MSVDSLTFTSEKDFENSVIIQLIKCGWERNTLNYPSKKDLLNNWKNILYENNRSVDKLSDYPLTDTEMDQIIDKIRQFKTPFNLNSFINGKTVTIKRDNPDDILHFGKEIDLHIYDRHEIAGGKSRYQIAKQPRFDANDTIFPSRRGDLMLLINGMPVIHIELKKSGSTIHQACNQIEKYSKEGLFNDIFALVQVFVAMTPDDAFYFTNPGTGGVFNSNFFFRWADADNIPIKRWNHFIQNLLHIPMAHQLIGFYTVADKKDGFFKVLRPYQYYAISSILNVVAKNKWGEHNQRGGYIWHTTGSGKTLTSFKTADLIAKNQEADKVVFLVDRIELDTQSLSSFKLFAEDSTSVQGVSSTIKLIDKLKSTNPADTLIVASIFKLARINEDTPRSRQKDIDIINKKRLVFIVDECHRDTFGIMMRTIKETFPNALFFGFSGTPIKDENMKKGSTSADVFGNELHRYAIGDGIRDGNVLPFDPIMVETFDSYQIKHTIALQITHIKSIDELDSDDVKAKAYSNVLNTLEMSYSFDSLGKRIKGAEDYLPPSQYKTEEHINAVVSWITRRHPVELSKNGKYHAIFATSSIPEALEYYKRLKGIFKVTVLVDKSDSDNSDFSYEKIKGLSEVIKDYNSMFTRNFSISNYNEMKTDVIHRLSHIKDYSTIAKTPELMLDILIVVDQMLTGFDSKWVKILYLDKVLKQENVIQAFSRTNRICDHDKPAGIIAYFRKPHTMRKYIDEAFETYSGSDKYAVFVPKIDENLDNLVDIIKDIKPIFTSNNMLDYSVLPDDVSIRAKFVSLFNKLNRALEILYVQGFSWKNCNHKYRNLKLDFTYEDYLSLLQRYKELITAVTRSINEEPPYELESYINQVDTGKIDADYMDTRFEKYLRLKNDNASPELIEEALLEVYRIFALLPREHQRIAELFISDVKLGNIVPDKEKKFHDYITERIYDEIDTQIKRFIDTFGLDETLLRDFLDSNPQPESFNEYGKFDELRKTADNTKIIEFFKKTTHEELSPYSARSRFSLLLKNAIILKDFSLDSKA